MAQLTQRQIHILKSVVEEFIETAEAVGSENLERKHSLGCSSATIRTEMSSLREQGFLKKSHSSAGRIPTSMGLKYYVRNLMTPKTMSISEEIGAKEKIWDYRNEFESLLKEATRELSRFTRTMAIATTEQGTMYYHGASNLLDQPELCPFTYWRRSGYGTFRAMWFCLPNLYSRTTSWYCGGCWSS